MKKYALCIILSLTACQHPTSYAPQVTAEELQKEEAAQQHLIDEAAEKGGMPRPWKHREGTSEQFERVADRIDKAGAAMCQEMELPKQNKRCYYYFELSRAREINANADGKTITVNSGMMRFLQSDDELAIVLGHELAHNLMGHIDSKRDNAMLGMIFGAALDGLAAPHGLPASSDGQKAGAQLGALTYSVEFEEEADYIGLYIAARAGYDIRRAPDMWRRMSLEEPSSLFNGYDHPTTAARAAAMTKAINEIESKREHHFALLPEIKPVPMPMSPAGDSAAYRGTVYKY